MQITRSTAAMFIELSPQISKTLGIHIGYIHPRIAFVQDDTQFVIRETTQTETEPEPTDFEDNISTAAEIQFIHVSDLHYRRDNGIFSHWVDEIKSDNKVQTLIDQVNQAILDGKLILSPGVTRSHNGEIMSVTQKAVSDTLNAYELPMLGPHGTLWTYDTIVSLSDKHPSFAFARKIIDEQWPEEWNKWLRREVARQADEQSEPIQESKITIIEKAWSLLRKLFQ